MRTVDEKKKKNGKKISVGYKEFFYDLKEKKIHPFLGKQEYILILCTTVIFCVCVCVCTNRTLECIGFVHGIFVFKSGDTYNEIYRPSQQERVEIYVSRSIGQFSTTAFWHWYCF